MSKAGGSSRHRTREAICVLAPHRYLTIFQGNSDAYGCIGYISRRHSRLINLLPLDGRARQIARVVVIIIIIIIGVISLLKYIAVF
jgi:hypothetical protein